MNQLRHLASVLVVSLAARAAGQAPVDTAPGAEPLRAGVLATDQAMEPDDVARAGFETPGGVLSIHEIAPASEPAEAVAPSEPADRPDTQERPTRFLVFWLDDASSLLYVYGTSVAYAEELGVALRSLERELGVSMEVTTAANPWLLQIVIAADESAGAEGESDGTPGESDGADAARWLPATRNQVRAVMGLAATDRPMALDDGSCDPAACMNAREGFDVDGLLNARPVVPVTPIEPGEPVHPVRNQQNQKASGRSPRDEPGAEEPTIYYACCGVPTNPCDGVTCSTSNPCKHSHCENGSCVLTNRINGSLCPDDGNVCTLDKCQGGNCTHPPKCTDGRVCCHGGCCLGACCNDETGLCCPSAAQCCGATCCDEFTICCNGTCEPCCDASGGACEGTCCDPPGGDCCGEPSDPAGESCCGTECCPGPCCSGDECCPHAGGQCCSTAPDGCCTSQEQCCTLGCCPSSPTGCCTAEEFCCPTSPTGCCPEGSECCATGCCELGPCCDDTCCPFEGGECCDTAPDGCCPPTEECCISGCCTPAAPCCGGTQCCDPVRCCGNGECCAQDCEGCIDNGTLSQVDPNATITVSANPVCVGETITFTALAVVVRRMPDIPSNWKVRLRLLTPPTRGDATCPRTPACSCQLLTSVTLGRCNSHCGSAAPRRKSVKGLLRGSSWWLTGRVAARDLDEEAASPGAPVRRTTDGGRRTRSALVTRPRHYRTQDHIVVDAICH